MSCVVKHSKSGKGVAFFCGPDLTPCKICMGWAEYLCDYPVGEGKTCDLALCEDHAFEIGNNYHLCPVHYAEYAAKRHRVREKGKIELVATGDPEAKDRETYEIWKELGYTGSFERFLRDKEEFGIF